MSTTRSGSTRQSSTNSLRATAAQARADLAVLKAKEVFDRRKKKEAAEVLQGIEREEQVELQELKLQVIESEIKKMDEEDHQERMKEFEWLPQDNRLDIFMQGQATEDSKQDAVQDDSDAVEETDQVVCEQDSVQDAVTDGEDDDVVQLNERKFKRQSTPRYQDRVVDEIQGQTRNVVYSNYHHNRPGNDRHVIKTTPHTLQDTRNTQYSQTSLDGKGADVRIPISYQKDGLPVDRRHIPKAERR